MNAKPVGKTANKFLSDFKSFIEMVETLSEVGDVDKLRAESDAKYSEALKQANQARDERDGILKEIVTARANNRKFVEEGNKIVGDAQNSATRLMKEANDNAAKVKAEAKRVAEEIVRAANKRAGEINQEAAEKEKRLIELTRQHDELERSLNALKVRLG